MRLSTLNPSLAALALLACVESPSQDSAPPEAGGPAAQPLEGARLQRLYAAERSWSPSPAGFSAWNAPRRLWAEVGAEGLRAEHEGEGLNITTVGWGRMGDWRPLPQVAPELGDCAGPEDASGDCERRVHLERPGLIEWWASRGEGMQQGWELEQRPAGDGPVVIELEVQGAEVEAEGDGGALWLTDEAGTLWRYAGLDAWDAHGQPLDAWMETDGARVWVAVDDEGAAWPISVDPVLTTASRTWTGTVPTDYFGFALAGAGDINNDGYDDVAVGSPGYSLTTGRVYIYFGSATGPGTTANVTLASPALASTFGAAVDFVGDVNNDGIDDIAVGAPLYTGSASQMGAVYVWHGSASFSGGTYTTQLTGSSSANAYFGSALSRGGDLDGDGYDDIIVGEYGYNSNRGRAWAFAGGASGAGADSVRLTGSTSANDHGFSVSGGGSINGDGYADVLVGAPRDSSSSANGRAYAYYGEAGFFGSATQSSDRSWTGFPAGELAGAAVQVRADVNGDGRDDALVGAPGAAKVYVYNGSASGFSSSATATLSGTAGTYFGNAIGNLGDTSGDGIDDVVIGAYTTSSSAGVAYVYDGSATGLSTASQTFTGSAAEQLGFSAVGAGDVNNDGYGDLLIGAPGWTSFTGEVFLYYGAVDADGDGYYAGTTAGTDCDDSDAAVNPGATELCDSGSVDEDCDGLINGDDPSATGTSTWYEDSDGDGYGDAASTTAACDAPTGYVGTSGDCDDSDAGVNPGEAEVCDPSNTDEDCDGLADNGDSSATGTSTWYQDGDSDGYGGTTSATTCDAPTGYTAVTGDCNDSSASVSPGDPEVCDSGSVDEDCDGLINGDDPSATGTATWYQDSDGDGYGGTTTTSACEAPTGYVGTGGDCDESAASINPGATEVCDASNTDEDCDSLADDADSSATGERTWYRDSDGDGYGNPSLSTTACDRPTGYVANRTDCDDTRATVSPADVEVCDADELDEDCDGLVNGDDPSATGTATWYQDSDGDGYGGTTSTSACDAPTGYVGTSGDCDDSVTAVNPGATEVCDPADVDEDCDGAADNSDSSAVGLVTVYTDADGDGYGDPGTEVTTCDPATGTVSVAGDCDDGAVGVNPGATELCDASDVDEDCDGLADSADSSATGSSTWYRDSDGDGYGSTTSTTSCDAPTGYVATGGDCDDVSAADNPGATEVTGNGDDDNCDGAEVCFRDLDDDGYRPTTGGTVTSTDTDCLDSGEARGSDPRGDCDDSDASVSPAGTEVCDADETDEDCDGLINGDDPSATGTATWYVDSDSDGYGDPTSSTAACDAPTGYVGNDEDCDDDDSAISPSEAELCDGADVDEDCDGLADDADPEGATGESTWYTDADGDRYGDDSTAFTSCDPIGGMVAAGGDCDDDTSTINPGAAELCDGDTDEDCDGLIDLADPSVSGSGTLYFDADGDGYGDPSVTVEACGTVAGYVTNNTDCDDSDGARNPGATEVCDAANTDEDCDGAADDADASVDTSSMNASYSDADGDSYGDDSSVVMSCDAVSGTVSTGGDCDDLDAGDHPGATEEVGNEDDEDCDGTELCVVDEDDDGYTADSPAEVASADLDCQDSGETVAGTAAGDCVDTDARYNPGATEDDCTDPTDYNCDGSAGAVDADGDGFAACEDCNDGDAGTYAGALEVTADGIDQDCDGTEVCYADADEDGWRTTDTVVSTDVGCAAGGVALESEPTLDCDDEDALTYPGAVELVGDELDEDCDGGELCYTDADEDGWHTGLELVSADSDCQDEDEAAADEDSVDCDDAAAGTYPGAPEVVGDGVDQDCDNGESCFADGDEDGYSALDGSLVDSVDADCNDAGEGSLSDLGGDCDDADDRYNPGAIESDCADPADYNCDGSVGFSDADGDGYAACLECNDADGAINPDATEVVGDSIDQNCDGLEVCYEDDDGDGWVDGSLETVDSADLDCLDLGEGRTDSPDGDCDEADAAVHPDAEELCNGIDDDCNTVIDDGFEGSTWYADLDGDGYGDPGAPIEACEEPVGAVVDATDCDDGDAASYPGAPEISDDGVDQDCDGSDLTSGTDTGEPTDSGDPGDSGITDSGSDGGDGADGATDSGLNGGEDSGNADAGFGDDGLGLDSGLGAGQYLGGKSCGCATPPSSGGLMAGLLSLLGLVGLRRRKD